MSSVGRQPPARSKPVDISPKAAKSKSHQGSPTRTNSTQALCGSPPRNNGVEMMPTTMSIGNANSIGGTEGRINHLEKENAKLQAQVKQLTARVEALELENRRLQNIINVPKLGVDKGHGKKTTFSKPAPSQTQSVTNTPSLPPIDSRPSTAPLHSALKRRDSHCSHKHAVVVPAPGRVPERETSMRVRPPTPGPPSCRGQPSLPLEEIASPSSGSPSPHPTQKNSPHPNSPRATNSPHLNNSPHPETVVHITTEAMVIPPAVTQESVALDAPKTNLNSDNV